MNKTIALNGINTLIVRCISFFFVKDVFCSLLLYLFEICEDALTDDYSSYIVHLFIQCDLYNRKLHLHGVYFFYELSNCFYQKQTQIKDKKCRNVCVNFQQMFCMCVINVRPEKFSARGTYAILFKMGDALVFSCRSSYQR